MQQEIIYLFNYGGRGIGKMKNSIQTKRIIYWLTVLGFILEVNSLSIAGNTATRMLMVSVQVVDKSSVNKSAVRSTPGKVRVSTLDSGQGLRVTKNYSISHALTIDRSSNVTVTGKIDGSMPAGTALYIGPATPETLRQDNMRLSTTEQELLTGVAEKVKEDTSIIYPFHYSLSASADSLDEIQQTTPVTVILAVSY
jgi:hypothetical protein